MQFVQNFVYFYFCWILFFLSIQGSCLTRHSSPVGRNWPSSSKMSWLRGWKRRWSGRMCQKSRRLCWIWPSLWSIARRLVFFCRHNLFKNFFVRIFSPRSGNWLFQYRVHCHSILRCWLSWRFDVAPTPKHSIIKRTNFVPWDVKTQKCWNHWSGEEKGNTIEDQRSCWVIKVIDLQQ